MCGVFLESSSRRRERIGGLARRWYVVTVRTFAVDSVPARISIVASEWRRVGDFSAKGSVGEESREEIMERFGAATTVVVFPMSSLVEEDTTSSTASLTMMANSRIFRTPGETERLAIHAGRNLVSRKYAWKCLDIFTPWRRLVILSRNSAAADGESRYRLSRPKE